MKSIVSVLAIVVLTAGGAGSAGAQELMEPFRAFKAGPQEPQEAQEAPAPHWCATPHLMSTPEGRAALESFHEARRNGQLPVAKGQESFEIGQIAAFNIISDTAWTSAEFELRISGNKWRAWLRSDDPHQTGVLQSRFEEMKRVLDEATPAGSVDPEKGVFENDVNLFGQTPVYPDGSDGIVDILIYLLDPGVAGFVSPSDYDRNAADTVGNQSEVVYLDVTNFDNTGSGSQESVFAHELQHVIQVNYDGRETPYVNEGQSEYAQEANGFPTVPPFHLYGAAPEYNIGLFTWRGLNSRDYTRGSLWTGYLAGRVGPTAIGMVTQSNKVGLAGYEDAFASAGVDIDIKDLVADFHTANLINDRDIDPRFGYVNEQRQEELLLMRVPPSSRFNGLEGSSLRTDSLIVEAGGAEYLVLENVTNLSLSVDVAAPPDFLETRRLQMLVRAIGTKVEGGTTMIEFNPSDQNHTLVGSFNEVRIIFAHIRPGSIRLRTTLEANWSQDPGRVVETQGDTRDAAAVLNDGSILAFSAGEGAQATMFLPPEGSVLDRVSLASFYFSQFGGDHGIPTTAPRDIVFTIWESNGFGAPGEVMYSEEMVDLLPYLPVVSADYNWFDVDLDPDLGKRSTALPDTMFIGIQDTGTDDNFLIIWPSFSTASPAKPTGFLRFRQPNGQIEWIRLWDAPLGEIPGDPLNRTVLPVRAHFVIDSRPVAIEATAEIPRQIELEQNYPNPFNPSTKIQFALPETADVGLEVFDVAGRRVANLIEGIQAPGTYTVTLDASNWTSGVYFYRLTAGSQRIMKRMILLK